MAGFLVLANIGLILDSQTRSRIGQHLERLSGSMYDSRIMTASWRLVLVVQGSCGEVKHRRVVYISSGLVISGIGSMSLRYLMHEMARL